MLLIGFIKSQTKWLGNLNRYRQNLTYVTSRGRVTHFVASMGTTGTIMGTSRFLKEANPAVQIVGLQPKEGASIAGIRRCVLQFNHELSRIGCYSFGERGFRVAKQGYTQRLGGRSCSRQHLRGAGKVAEIRGHQHHDRFPWDYLTRVV
jgi:hypothetical protein